MTYHPQPAPVGAVYLQLSKAEHIGCVEEPAGRRLTLMRLNSEEMKGLGSGRWMQPLGKAFSQLLSQSDTTPSWEYSVPYQGSTLSVFPCTQAAAHVTCRFNNHRGALLPTCDPID